MKWLTNEASALVRKGCRRTCTVRIELDKRMCTVLENLRRHDDHIGVTAERVLNAFAAAVCGNKSAQKAIDLAIEAGPGVELHKEAGWW